MRRGLGIGKGKGYYNMIPRDPRIHGDSALGRKQPQRIPNLMLPMKNANRLPVQVGIIVPKTRYDKKIKQKEFNKRVREEERWFSTSFGGDTSIDTAGGFIKNKRLIKERGKWVYSSMTSEGYAKFRKKIAEHIRQRQKEWKQYSILLKVEGVDFIVPKDNDIPDDKKLKSIPVG